MIKKEKRAILYGPRKKRGQEEAIAAVKVFKYFNTHGTFEISQLTHLLSHLSPHA